MVSNVHPLAVAFVAVAMAAATTHAAAQNVAQIKRASGGDNCVGCNLFQADFSGKTLKGKTFSHARLRQADLSLGVFTASRFDHADLRDVNFYGALAGHADFTGADLRNASLVGGYFQAARFAHAKLDGANLGGADLIGALGLNQAMLSTACGDAATRLPSGLDVPACK